MRDTARHNGNGTRLDNEREWMRSPIGGVLMCTHAWRTPTSSIGLMRYCPPSRTCEGLHTLDHHIPPPLASKVLAEYAITQPGCTFLDAKIPLRRWRKKFEISLNCSKRSLKKSAPKEIFRELSEPPPSVGISCIII